MRKKKYKFVSCYGTILSILTLDNSIINDIILMKNKKEILERIKLNPKNVRFDEICKLCENYFGPHRQSGSSHRIYGTPWIGDPRINIQNCRGKAKAYQVKQVLAAIEKLEETYDKQN